jgi:hypothetical protein
MGANKEPMPNMGGWDECGCFRETHRADERDATTSSGYSSSCARRAARQSAGSKRQTTAERVVHWSQREGHARRGSVLERWNHQAKVQFLKRPETFTRENRHLFAMRSLARLAISHMAHSRF